MGFGCGWFINTDRQYGFAQIESLKKIPKIKITSAFVEASVKGYFNLGKFEAGPWILTYQNNDVEGNRFRIGGRTNQFFSQYRMFEGYLAYGSKDNNLKGSLKAEQFIMKKSWTKIGIYFRHDLEHVGALDEFYSPGGFFNPGQFILADQIN
ncbi:MAG: hypothetical protein HC906_19030 [Bacteroidales bacterium]|nr:hypothetical protein [Bacteroidales bacterium]